MAHRAFSLIDAASQTPIAKAHRDLTRYWLGDHFSFRSFALRQRSRTDGAGAFFSGNTDQSSRAIGSSAGALLFRPSGLRRVLAMSEACGQRYVSNCEHTKNEIQNSLTEMSSMLTRSIRISSRACS
jgi:hypothetical protein